MRKIIVSLSVLMLVLSCGTPARMTQGNNSGTSYVIGFYNLENLFDIYHDDGKNDYEYLPDGANNWTEAKYTKKLQNMARVIAEMKKDNGVWHAVLGVSEVENRHVLEDLVSEPAIADANYQIVHYDSPDRRGVDCALFYRPDVFKFIASEAIPFTFDPSRIDWSQWTQEEKDNFKTRDVLMVRGTIDGEMFAFFVCHLPSRLGGKGADLRPEDLTDEDFFDPFLSMIKAGYASLYYQGGNNIFDIVMVNNALANAAPGTFQIQPIVKQKYYGRIFTKPFMTNQSGQYKGTPLRTFSGGSFVGGFSDHYPTYIVIKK